MNNHGQEQAYSPDHIAAISYIRDLSVAVKNQELTISNDAVRQLQLVMVQFSAGEHAPNAMHALLKDADLQKDFPMNDAVRDYATRIFDQMTQITLDDDEADEQELGSQVLMESGAGI